MVANDRAPVVVTIPTTTAATVRHCDAAEHGESESYDEEVTHACLFSTVRAMGARLSGVARWPIAVGSHRTDAGDRLDTGEYAPCREVGVW